MKLLHKGSFEYGWSHSGVRSWGGNWHDKARNVALEQIRSKIATMVNLKELETFVKKDLKSSLTAGGSSGNDSSSFNIGFSDDKSSEQKEKWINENNYLIDVKNVRIKPGSDWSKTRDERPFGGRSWDASATMECDIFIYGKA